MIQKTEQEVMQNWGSTDELKVSICCITYNHEPYIRDTLDGFLMQETDFSFEILVDDDCSKDHTQDIIREYQEKYPNIIKPLLREKNVGAIINFTENIKRSNGKYIALCEGDDYWTDFSKIQKQVDFLAEHDEVIMTFENAIIHFYDKQFKLVKEEIFNHDLDSGYIKPIDLVQEKRITPTASVIFRNNTNVIDFFADKGYFPFGDTPMFLYLAKYGKLYYMNRVTSVYRKHTTGIVNLTFDTLEVSHKFIKYYKFVSVYFKDFNIAPIIKKHMSDRYYLMSKLYYQNKEFSLFCKSLFLAVVYNPLKMIKRINANILRKLKILK